MMSASMATVGMATARVATTIYGCAYGYIGVVVSMVYRVYSTLLVA